MQLLVDMWKWQKYYLSGKRSTPTSEVAAVRYPPRVSPGMNMRQSCKYYSDGKRSAPTSQLVGNGRERVVKILLWRKEFNPYKPDTIGQIPLLHAARSGYEGVREW